MVIGSQCRIAIDNHVLSACKVDYLYLYHLIRQYIFLIVIPRPYFLSEIMAHQRIQLVFQKLVRLLPELFTTVSKIVKGTTETVVMDKGEIFMRSFAQDFPSSNDQGENSSQEEDSTILKDDQ